METLRSRVRAFLAEVSPAAEVRRLMEDERGYDLDVWLRLAADHDLLALETWRERAVVLGEAGRALLCAPYLATVTAAPFVSPEVKEAVAGGLCIATVALAEPSGRWDDAGVQARALQAADGRWRLEGEKSYVVDGCAADVLVVAARAGAGVALFEVDGDAPGLDRVPLATVDQTRRLAHIRLAATPARPLDGSPAAALDLCAEMLLDLESARAAAADAAGAAGTADLRSAAAVAKVCCSEAYVRIATDSLHVHGGLGFTWDHDAHLYLRRARSSLHLFGDPRHHRDRLARHIGL